MYSSVVLHTKDPPVVGRRSPRRRTLFSSYVVVIIFSSLLLFDFKFGPKKERKFIGPPLFERTYP